MLWNAPSYKCAGLRAAPLADYDIIANPEDSFNGSAITILYDSGDWPSLNASVNATPCWLSPGGKQPCSWNPWGQIAPLTNGGVPQVANVSAHEARLSAIIQERIPSASFAGVVIVDWEAWRPLTDENDDSLSCYTEYSRRLVRAVHPDWNDTAVAAAAAAAFDAGARTFFEATVHTIRRLRPLARVGFYSQGINQDTTPSGEAADDKLLWLWSLVGCGHFDFVARRGSLMISARFAHVARERDRWTYSRPPSTRGAARQM